MSKCDKCGSLDERETDHEKLAGVMDAYWAELCRPCQSDWRKVAKANPTITKLKDVDQRLEVLQYVTDVLPRTESNASRIEKLVHGLIVERDELSDKACNFAREWVAS